MALIVDIKAVPQSGRQEWRMENSGVLKVYLKSAPERGEANRELVKILAKALSLPQGDISIISGLSSRNKKVKIEQNMSKEQFLAMLGVVQQMKLF